MARLESRIMALELLNEDHTPAPVAVCTASDPAEIAEFKRVHAGERIILITTICSRKCVDTCTGKQLNSCRYNIPGTQEYIQQA